MSAQLFKRIAGSSARWLGRGLGSFAIVLVGMLLFADPPQLKHLTPAVTGQLLMLSLAVLGIPVAWRKELLGGSAILAGLVGFCIVQMLVNGSLPAGQVVPFWSILGICPIVADWLTPLPGSERPGSERPGSTQSGSTRPGDPVENAARMASAAANNRS